MTPERLAAVLPFLVIPIFLLFFAALWLAVTTLTGWLAGWFRLAAAFPDTSQPTPPTLRGITGTMGLGVTIRGALVLSVGPAGLRVGMARVIGPFCRDFLVPWQAIRVSRRNAWFGSRVRLEFGEPAIGTLTISASVGDRLAHAAGASWPEAEVASRRSA